MRSYTARFLNWVQDHKGKWIVYHWDGFFVYIRVYVNVPIV